MDPPNNTENRQIFPWNYEKISYNTLSFTPAKANFLDQNSLYSLMNQLENGVENYDIKLIKASCCVTWGVTFVILVTCIFSMIVLVTTDLYWGIAISVLVFGLSIYSMWSTITNERRRTTDRVVSRQEAIGAILKNWNETTGKNRNVFMETGDLAAWLELHVNSASKLQNEQNQMVRVSNQDQNPLFNPNMIRIAQQGKNF